MNFTKEEMSSDTASNTQRDGSMSSISLSSKSSMGGKHGEGGGGGDGLSVQELGIDTRTGGLGFMVAAGFIIAQMAGAGFLSLPSAMANCGWLGIALMLIFAVAVIFAGIRLSRCWMILEERWPEYRKPVRQPYMEIAYRSLGIHGRRLAFWSIVINLLGSTIVFIILMGQLLNTLVCDLSICHWVCIVGAVITPVSWLGTPKDFWPASVLAAGSTAVCCVVIFVQLMLEKSDHTNPQYPNPTVGSFSLGFGAIVFAYGGSSVFPTIQNDMRDRGEFWKSLLVGFISIFCMYLPVAVSGYVIIGNEVESNILLSIKQGPVVTAAIILELINLLGTFLVSFNPVMQSLEDIMNIPAKFCWQRVAFRTSVVVLEVIIGLGVPDFGLILNLIGGSVITICVFVLPPLMYMRLVDMDDTESKWPSRSIAWWERLFLWEILIVGVVGGLCSTVSGIVAITDPDNFSHSCFTEFNGYGVDCS